MHTSPTTVFRTKYGAFSVRSFKASSSTTHVAMVMGGELNQNSPMVRVQSACMTSTALGGIICDCADQIDMSLRMIASAGQGLFLYLDEEGRGLGLHDKIITMAEMNKGADTVTAFTQRGLSHDVRTYEDVGKILSDLGISKSIRLITNNPNKIDRIKEQGFNIIERIPVEIPPTDLTRKYLYTKKHKMGHLLAMV